MTDKSPIQPKAPASLRQTLCWALVLSSMISTPVLSAQTDISSSPITSTNAAQVKPNIMLLMDTSGSMGWGHMPDEVETQVGINSIGYKAAQCNVLYYNRTQTYAIPKQANGTPFAVPSFTSAPYDGYSAFNGASSATVDLSGAFKAYDDKTLRTSGYNDTPQPAYYYYKTGGTVPITSYASSPCADGDASLSVPSSDGGTWTRVLVGSSSGVGGTDERQNFAIWYSFYRTRILLIKSAATLAFTPLTDSFRVGFITVKPKDHANDSAINPSKYLAIDDFNTTQRGLWFSKVLSQVPSGSSPTREGLARVGRMYAGKHDGINTGMDDDPVQYSCQQNFTIMTTDGYWNAQDESTAQGAFIGGPVDMSGKALVGEQDGNLNASTSNHPSAPATDFNGTPRPIWDGTFDGTRTITSKTVHNSYVPCGTYFSMTTAQVNTTTSQLLSTTTQYTQSTTQTLQSTLQALQTTQQMLQSTSQTAQSTVQNLRSTTQILQSTAQRLQSTAQTTQSTLQNLQSTKQILQSTTQNLVSTSQALLNDSHTTQKVVINLQSTTQTLASTSQLAKSTSQQQQQTVQVTKSTSQITKTTSQTNKNTSQTIQNTTQNLKSTTQNLQSTSQVLQSTSQTRKSTSQTLLSSSQNIQSTSQVQATTSQVRQSTSQLRSCDSSTELCSPGPVGSCTPGGHITCETVTTGPTLVSSCTNAVASSGNNWTSTTCAVTSTGPTPTASCTAAAASPTNSYTTTSCNTATTGPVAVATCNPATAGSGNAYTATNCSTNNAGPTPVATCTPATASSSNAYTTTTCTPVNTGPTAVSSCSAQTAASGNSWTTITCAPNTTTNVPVASCTAASPSSSNAYTTTTCTPVTTTNVAVLSCTGSAGTSANAWTTTTCATNNTSNVAVSSCSPISPTSANGYTTTSCSTNNISNVPSGSCVGSSANSGNAWTTTTCGTLVTGPTPIASASCTPATGNSGNSWTTTTCPVTNSGPTPVASCSAATASSSNAWTTTTCPINSTGPTPIASCTNAAATSGNSWTATTCGSNTSAATPVSSCTAVAASSGNSYTATTCPVATTGPTGVSSCTGSAASSGNSWTTTTCATLTSGPTPVASCTNAAAASGNSWTATTCSNNNTSNVQVNSCSAAGPTSSNGYTTTTCPTPTVVSGPTNVGSCSPSPATDSNGHQQTICSTSAGSTPVQAGTCVPQSGNSSNNYVTITCTTALTGPLAALTCTPQTGTSGNSWVTTTCGTNNTTNVAVASCSPASPIAANSFTTTTCPTPITTGPTPIASCTPITATAGNSWVATTCSTATTGPIGVSSCASVSASSGNAWTATTCGNNNTSNVPVASCSNSGPTSANGYTTTTCANNNTTNVAVASCTGAVASAANSWVLTTCSNNNTTNVPVASCSGSAATSGNLWTATSCSNNNTTNVPSGTCSASAATSGNGWTTTTCPVLTTAAVGVSSCTPSPGTSANTWITTICTPNNNSNLAVPSCTPSGPTSANGYTTTTCSNNNTSNVAVASCSSGSPTAGNGYTTTTCTPNNTTNVPSGSCTPSSPTAANGYTTTSCPVLVVGPIGAPSCTAGTANSGNAWTTTVCPGTAVTGPTPSGACTGAIGDSTNSWKTTTCTTVTSAPSLVTTCNPAPADAGNNWTATICAPASGEQLATTTYTRVQQYTVSGGVQSSGGTDVTTTNGPNASGTCYAPGTQPALPVDGPASWTSADATAYPSCSGWPCTVNVNTGNPQSINSLADVAQYYYITDLRTPANESRGPSFTDDNVPAVDSTVEGDKARWQHMTTFSIALGVSGSIKYVSDYKTSTVSGATDSPVDTRFADIRVGADTAGNVANWPLWPDPAVDYVGDPNNYNDPRSIDDFWHAAVNGRGQYFSAGNPTSVIAGLAGALAGITARVASSTGAGTSNLEPVPGDNFVYLANYNTQKWTGDVQAHEIDVNTGIIQSTIIWSAQSLLDAKVGNGCDNRKIYLFRNGATNNLTNFSWNTLGCDSAGNPTGAADTGLNSTEQGNFGSTNVSLLSQYPSMTDGTLGTPDQRTAAAGANLVNFLRGQRGYENFAAAQASQLYRKRDHVLGDIVNGQPVYVRAPFATYADNGYATFAATNAGRTPMLYVAGNDGMLHAFYAGTSETDTQGGKEAWAVVPSTMLPKLYTLADANYQNVHQYFVDGTPSVSDVYDGTNWHTLLVGGLNDGGRSFYALDVTDPANPKGMWEFNWSSTVCPANPANATGNSADCHLGLSFGHPLISKLSDGTWVVMVTSGYNNVNASPQTGDGGGYLYVLNAMTGHIIYKIPTGAGSPTTPSGLAQINAFVDKAEIDNTTVRVYGTDVLGNIWRFDVNDNTAPAGREAALVGTATDAGGTPQPITIRPELTQVGDNPMLFVATGKLLGATDVADVQTQTIYGIIDPVTGNPTYANLRSALVPLTMGQVGSGTGAYRTISCQGTSAACALTNGWRVDLPDTGERVNVEMKLRLNTLIVGSNVPQISACSAGGYSWLNYLNYSSGQAVSSSANVSVSQQVANSLIVGLTVVKLANGTIKAIVTTSDAGVITQSIPVATDVKKVKRISWREVPAS